jgi:hypothetical protein
MGGRRLSRQKALRPWLFCLAVTVALLASACPFSGTSKKDEPQPSPPAATSTPTATPSATATPDPFATRPTSESAARQLIDLALKASPFSCSPKLMGLGAHCLNADFDGDKQPDTAILFPVNLAGTQATAPAAVFVVVHGNIIEELATDASADASLIGIAFFEAVDRSGDGVPEVTFLQTACTATGCRTRAVVDTWDGTAWRDIGPGDAVGQVDAAAWNGVGQDSKLTIHGGKLPATAPRESGPTRSEATTYAYDSGRYSLSESKPDPPEYLYHAVQDADRVFKKDLAASIAAYQSVVAARDLKDWQATPDQPDRRPSLVGYALFRVAVVNAALGQDPGPALDAVILQSSSSGEPLFGRLATEFRAGYQEDGGVIGACARANRYLNVKTAEADNPAYVAQLFNYGYANPPGSSWVTSICPF